MSGVQPFTAHELAAVRTAVNLATEVTATLVAMTGSGMVGSQHANLASALAKLNAMAGQVIAEPEQGDPDGTADRL